MQFWGINTPKISGLRETTSLPPENFTFLPLFGCFISDCSPCITALVMVLNDIITIFHIKTTLVCFIPILLVYTCALFANDLHVHVV